MKQTTKKINDARILPHSIEAEQCVLGCAFIDQDASYNIVSGLKVDDFYSETHQIIFEAMQKVMASNVPIDFVTIAENLEKSGKLESVGGAEYLISLTNIIPSASNYEHYINIVKNDSVLRQLISAGQDIINKSLDEATKLMEEGLKGSHVIAMKNQIVIGDAPDIKDMVNCFVLSFITFSLF